jgi:hypothetical protein
VGEAVPEGVTSAVKVRAAALSEVTFEEMANPVMQVQSINPPMMKRNIPIPCALGGTLSNVGS